MLHSRDGRGARLRQLLPHQDHVVTPFEKMPSLGRGKYTSAVLFMSSRHNEENGKKKKGAAEAHSGTSVDIVETLYFQSRDHPLAGRAIFTSKDREQHR